MSDNPYQTPEAALDQEEGLSGLDPEAVQEPRRVAFGRGWAWIREANGLFKRQRALWVGLVLTAFIINTIVSLVPGLNMLGGLIWMILVGGLFYAAMRTDTAGNAAFGDLFQGFRQQLRGLVGIGLFFLLGTAVAATVNISLAAALGLSEEMLGIYTGSLDPANAQLPPVFWLILMAGSLLVMLPVYAAVGFAPGLVLLNGVGVRRALRMSLVACLRNILPMFLYSLAIVVLFFLGALPLLLGLVVVIPVITLSGYTAYRDIFYPAPA